MIVRDIVFVNPLRNIVRLSVFDVAGELMSIAGVPGEGRTTAFLTTLGQIGVAIVGVRKLLED
jgi:hypothetical protein